MATEPDVRLSHVFVELADTLTDDFDLLDFLTRLCSRLSDLLGADAAGVIAIDAQGVMRIMASSTEQMRVLELFEVQNAEGPCLDALRSRQAVTNVALADADTRWPRFAPLARDDGFALVHAFPMRLRDDVVGVVNVFAADAGGLTHEQALVAQAMTDIATIGLLQERALREGRVLTDQLQYALTARVVVEQAKGMLAERMNVELPDAFALLRSYARAKNLRVADVARKVVESELSVEDLNTHQ